MKPRNAASINFNSITPFCQDKKSLYVRIAILSAHIISFSDQIGATLLFLESLQLMSQIILLNSHFQPTTDINPSNVLYKAILLIAKVLTPSQLIIFEGVTVNTCITLMSILTLIFLLKVILFIYIVVLATINSREKPMLLKVWAFIAKSHNKIGYYLLSSFWTRIIYLFSNNKVSGAENSILTTWCVIVIILEFSLAVIFQLVSSYYLPTKDFLSTKCSQTEMTILLQKGILQILEFSPIPHTNAIRWIVACLNTLFCLARDFLFFRTFPYYKTKALFYQLRLSLATTCLSFAYLVFRFLRSVHYDNSGIDVTFVMITWGILTYLATKVGLSYLHSVLYNLVTTSNNKYSPDILLHKIMFLREFLKSGLKASQSGLEYGWSFIQKECCIKNLRQALNLKEDYPINLETDLQLKQSVRQLATLYLEELSLKFPNNNLVKLFLAYYYGKRQKLYGLSMTILVNLRHNSPSIITDLNISLLIQKMQFRLIAEQQAEDVALDIYTYIKSLSAVDSLKGCMLNQAQLQIDLCDEILQSTPNLRNILVFSQKISRQRSVIEKKTKYILKHVPEYYVEPLKFLAHYQLILNHSSELFEQYSKEYDAKTRKYEQFFAKDGLCPENLYEKKNLIMVISGRKENLTTVVHRNSPTFEVYGRDILGDKCYTVGHPALQKFFQQSFQISLERGDGRISRQILRAYQYNNHKGWAGPCDFYIEISPFLSQGLYYFAVLRMFKNYEEFIILNEDGTIDCCSKKIGYELGCLPLPANATKNSTHISQISKELGQVNHAFNMTAFPEKYKGINDNKKEQKKDDSCDVSSDFSRFSHPFRSGTYNTRLGTYHSTNLSTTQAQELFSLYSTEGQGVRLRSIKRPEKSYFYNCKVQNQLFDTVLIKMVILEKSNEYEDNLSETTDSGPLKSELPEVKRNNEDKSGQIVGLKSEDLNVDEDDQVSEDEKRDGWINFERLTSLNSPLEPKSPDKLLPSYRDAPSSTRNLLSTQNRFTSELRMNCKSRPLPSARDPEAPKVPEKKEHLIEEPERNRLANNIMEATKSAKVSKAFNDTLKIKYYTRFYRTFVLLWYAVLTALLVNQIRLSVLNTSKIKNLQVNKNILRTSSTRTNYLMSVHLNLRSLWTIVYTDPTHSFDTTNLLDYLDILLDDLKDANQGLLLAAGNVTEETRNNWFQNDITISENSQSDYTHLNNFQAIDRIIVSGGRGIATARVNIVDSLPDVNFVLRNSLNDLLVKTNEISDNILSSIAEQAKESLNHLDINLWITVNFLIIMTIYFVIMVYVQFKNETANLFAFTKLSKKTVENIMDRFILFKRVIEEDQDFDEIQKKRHVSNYTRGASHHKGRINTREFQSQGYKGVSRKFFLYGLETIFLLTVITTIIGISHMMSSNNVTNNKKHFIQLHFADEMNQIVSLALTTLFEIKANPNATNTTYVQNIPILTDMTYQLQELSNLITETPSRFPQGDLASDPVLEEIIYEDSCKYIEGMYFKYLCQKLQTGGSSNGVIQVLSDLNLYISDSLAQPMFTSFADQLATVNKNLASGAIFTSLSDVINNNFDQSLADNIAASRLINAAIITSLIVVCIVVHIFVLRGLGESDNTFKKVLQNFPASVILSNFMLKSFLLKTSKGILTSMRNEI